MTKAASRKTKRAAVPVHAANDPTPERLARAVAVVIDAPRMSDEAWTGPAGKSTLVLSPVKRWHQAGWLDDAGFVAMHGYETLLDRAGYERSRSCLDLTPKGEGGCPPTVVAARDRLAVISFAASFACSADAWAYVMAIVRPGGAEREDEVAIRMLPRMGRDRQRETRRAWVGEVAAALRVVMA